MPKGEGMFRELTPPECFGELAEKPDAVLIDCRAPAEWHFTGSPDLSSIGKKALLLAIADESGHPNPEFVATVTSIAGHDTPLYLLCRVGGRSANACQLLGQAGFTDLVNVTEGFEGRVDENGHRNTTEGWKFHGLPWHQG